MSAITRSMSAGRRRTFQRGRLRWVSCLFRSRSYVITFRGTRQSPQAVSPRCGRKRAMASTATRIGIVGGGIGGLTLALAFRRRGLAADVYEQSSELREIGAAVALSANATRE